MTNLADRKHVWLENELGSSLASILLSAHKQNWTCIEYLHEKCLLILERQIGSNEIPIR